MQAAKLAELVANQRAGWSLERPFYTSAELYDFERRGWLADQWYILGHSSEVREPGSYIVRELLGESLILARDGESVLRGFYNVCRHRGSRICEHGGHARTLTCPYHAWSYSLDGSLRAAAALPQGINKSELALRSMHVRELGGIIMGSLGSNVGLLDEAEREAASMLHYHGIPNARIAARRRYPIRANWKLVVENFLECYHCFACHPEFCSVMRFVDVAGRAATADVADSWHRTVEQWFQNEADPACPVKRRSDFSHVDAPTFGVSRGPIGGGYKTASKDGIPVAPLMGSQHRFDGGNSNFRVEPFIWLSAYNDYASLIRFLPAGPEETDVEIIWLVDGSAAEAAVDVERMVWLWDVTTLQDKTIIEHNAAGVRSRAYSPGPYSTLESWTTQLTTRYLKEIGTYVVT